MTQKSAIKKRLKRINSIEKAEELDKLLLEGLEGPFTDLPNKKERQAMNERIKSRSAQYRVRHK